MESSAAANELERNHNLYMERCIELAKVAFDQGNTAVGSIVVCHGEIIGEGAESLPRGNDITGHAELIAVQRAVDHLGCRTVPEATLYSTAEPCFMCSYAIRHARIERVVYCLDTPTVGGATSEHPILIDKALNPWRPAPEVVAGVHAEAFAAARLRWKT